MGMQGQTRGAILLLLLLAVPAWAVEEVTLTISNASQRALDFTLQSQTPGATLPGMSVRPDVGHVLPPGHGVTFNFLSGQALLAIAADWGHPTNEPPAEPPDLTSATPVLWDNPNRHFLLLWRDDTNSVLGTDHGELRCVPSADIMLMDLPASRAYTLGVVSNQWNIMGRPRPFVPREQLVIPEDLQFFIPIEQALDKVPHQAPRLPVVAAAPTELPACLPRGFLDHHRRTILGFYLKHGQRDPTWDEQARAFLTAYTEFYPGWRSERYMLDPWIPLGPDYGEAQLGQLVDQMIGLADLECSDPMVLYVTGEVILRAFDLDQLSSQIYRRWKTPLEDLAEQQLVRAVQGFEQRPYPAIGKLRALLALRGIVGLNSTKHALTYDPQLMSLMVTQLVDGSFEQEDQLAWLYCRRATGTVHMSDLVECYANRPEQQKLSGWMWNMIMGAGYERRAELEALEGNGAFQEFFDRAAEYYRAAWNADPTRPEAPTQMVQLARKRPAGMGGQTVREWFEQAAMLGPDQTYLHSLMINGMLPGLDDPYGYMEGFPDGVGGTFEAAMEFGEHCAATERYDTTVPLALYMACREIAKRSADFDIWGRPGMSDKVFGVLHGCAENPRFARSRNWLLSLEAGLAIHRKDDRAASLIEQLGWGMDLRALDLFGISEYDAKYLWDKLLGSSEMLGCRPMALTLSPTNATQVFEVVANWSPDQQIDPQRVSFQPIWGLTISPTNDGQTVRYAAAAAPSLLKRLGHGGEIKFGVRHPGFRTGELTIRGQ